MEGVNDMSMEAMADLGGNVRCVCQDEECSVYKLEDETGEGIITCYRVFPGVHLLYHDFHMDRCMSSFQPVVDMFCIDHCREGRLEWELDDGICQYMEAGDLQMNARCSSKRMFYFPSRHYHGISISFALAEASAVLPTILEGFQVDIDKLHETFCQPQIPFIMRAQASIEHIFSELYDVPDSIRACYFKIKVLELLLFLSTLKPPFGLRERPYFYKSQVEKVKAIMELMTTNLHHHYTLEELAATFEFPITSMKNCFKGVYGTSIFAYMKTYRMNVAASRLRHSKDSIIKIALEMGYDNASKFSAAFKAVMSMTPVLYRKSAISNQLHG